MGRENVRSMLEEAFEAQRADSRIETPPEYRAAGFKFSNALMFRYQVRLPTGVKEFVRPPAGLLGQGDPYIAFDEPLDMDLMEQYSIEVFGRKARIERENTDRVSLRKRVLWGFSVSRKCLLRFWRQRIGHGGGILEYYTDTSSDEFSEDTPKVIEIVARYLESKYTIPAS